MVGRSGNRGLCAQPCRLPYELCSSENKILDKGYILSPRDLCSITLLPELIKSGIDSFKIEGRMKTPLYVSTVTRIYRKYINIVMSNINLNNDEIKKIIEIEFNKKNLETDLSDKEELIQVFNRGEFSKGHLLSKPNKNLIFKEKPNNMGFFIGTVSNFNNKKGHINLKLENSISIGDKISVNNEIYNISEIMINNKNFQKLEKGTYATIGRMKGKILNGDKIFRIEKNSLSKFANSFFKDNKEFIKIPLNCEISVKKDCPIKLKIWSNYGFYNGLNYTSESKLIPETALTKPITKEKIIEQLSKTGNTEFEFKQLNVNLDDNLFIPNISILNELRRNALNGLENLIIQKNTHNLLIKNNFKYNESNLSKEKFEYNDNKYINPSKNLNILSPNISLLLNIINNEFNYKNLTNINKLYIPFKYFTNKNYSNYLLELCKTFNIYIYMPNIIKDSFYLKQISETKINKNLEKIIDFIIKTFNIKGFVISHTSEIELLSKYNLDMIGNYTLNIYNNYTIDELKKIGISTTTLSPELEEKEIKNVINNSKSNSEIIVYGKIPVMTNNYCYLGKSNNCYTNCDKKCLNNNSYYLKDRKNAKFRIIPDNTCTITTIFNHKPIKLNLDNINTTNIRIDILDENFDEIINILKNYK